MNTAFGIRSKVFIQHCVVPTDASVWPLLVIMFQPHAKDVVELSSTEADEMIQDLAFRGSNVAFTKSVRHRSTWRSFDGLHFGLFPEFVELVRVLSITIPNEESGVDAFVFHPHRSVPRLLHYPPGIRMIGARTRIDLSTAQMDKYKDIGIADSTESEDGLRKKVTGDDAVHVSVNKGRPWYGRVLSGLLWLGEVPLLLENVSDRGRADSDSKFFEFPYDPTIPPTQIFGGQPHNQLASRERSSGSAQRKERPRATRLPKPLPISSWKNNVQNLIDVMVHRGAQPEQFRSLCRRRDNPTGFDTSPEHPNLRFKQLNPRVVSGTHPLRHHGHQRIKYGIHRNSFPFGNVAKRPDNTGCLTMDTFPNPQAPRDLRVFPEKKSRCVVVGA